MATKEQRNGNEVTHTRTYNNVKNEENGKNENNVEVIENSENEFSFKENPVFNNPLFGQITTKKKRNN